MLQWFSVRKVDWKRWGRGVRPGVLVGLLCLLQVALSAPAQAATAPVGATIPGFGGWVAYRFTYPGNNARVGVTLTYSPADAFTRVTNAIVLEAFSPDNPPPKGAPIGGAHRISDSQMSWELTSGVPGNYFIVIHNWDPKRRPVTVQVTTTNLVNQGDGPKLTFVSSAPGSRSGTIANGIVVDGIVVDGIVVDGIVVD